MAQRRRCKNCRKQVPLNDAYIVNINAFCDLDCCVEWSKSDRARKDAEKLEKRDLRSRKEALKTLSDWRDDAQKSVNAYIRIRDRDKLCVSCQKPFKSSFNVGGHFDAGHYIPRGSGANGRGNALRYLTTNIHGQCKQCNNYLRGNYSEFRKGLIGRIGLDAVIELEEWNEPIKWTVPHLRRIKDVYAAKRLLYKKRFR